LRPLKRSSALLVRLVAQFCVRRVYLGRYARTRLLGRAANFEADSKPTMQAVPHSKFQLANLLALL
jgi:hypothetical protein